MNSRADELFSRTDLGDGGDDCGGLLGVDEMTLGPAASNPSVDEYPSVDEFRLRLGRDIVISFAHAHNLFGSGGDERGTMLEFAGRKHVVEYDLTRAGSTIEFGDEAVGVINFIASHDLCADTVHWLFEHVDLKYLPLNHFTKDRPIQPNEMFVSSTHGGDGSGWTYGLHAFRRYLGYDELGGGFVETRAKYFPTITCYEKRKEPMVAHRKQLRDKILANNLSEQERKELQLLNESMRLAIYVNSDLITNILIALSSLSYLDMHDHDLTVPGTFTRYVRALGKAIGRVPVNPVFSMLISKEIYVSYYRAIDAGDDSFTRWVTRDLIDKYGIDVAQRDYRILRLAVDRCEPATLDFLLSATDHAVPRPVLDDLLESTGSLCIRECLERYIRSAYKIQSP